MTKGRPWSRYFRARLLLLVLAVLFQASFMLCVLYDCLPSAEKSTSDLTNLVKETSTLRDSPALRRLSLDVISIGSISRLDYVTTQADTFGSHPLIRAFHPVTESDVMNETCGGNMTTDDFNNIVLLCKQNYTVLEPRWSRFVRQYFAPKKLLSTKKNPMGWLCAQTRPAMALYHALINYNGVFPDYLVIIDDDSYLNVELLYEHLRSRHESDRKRPTMLAGCLFSLKEGIEFPHGGFGVVLNSAFLKSLATQRVKSGLTMLEWVHRLVTAQPFSEYREWDRGYCLHSDW